MKIFILLPVLMTGLFLSSPSTGSTGLSSLEIRLVDGPNNATGRVEILYNGTWGTVCDDGWDLRDADVVCRMLGFDKAASAPVMAEYGEGSGDILLDDLECTGLEQNLGECRKRNYGDHNCDHTEDAGLKCEYDSTPTDMVDVTDSDFFYTDIIATDYGFPALEVRLVNGSDNATGRVEVEYNGIWGTVCDDGWDLNDARVVCRMLGFTGAAAAPVMATYGEGSGAILLDEVWCLGTENGLNNCMQNDYGYHDCDHSEDAGVICEVLDVYDEEGTTSWSAIEIDWPNDRPAIWIPTTYMARSLEVRLVNGPDNFSGRVEVLHDGKWGTVCDDGWDLNDANVVCRMLGLFKASSAPVMATYGEGTGDILLDETECLGSEYSLEDCKKSEYGVHNCEHLEDAGVICEVPKSFQVRLADGPNDNIGRVEVMESGSWGTVCDDDWDAQDANVVCRMLGFFGAAYSQDKASYGEGQGDILLKNTDCMGTERNLGLCFYDVPELYDCLHDEDAGAACLNYIAEDSRILELSPNVGNMELQCRDLDSVTDKDLSTSSTVTIHPRILHGPDNHNISVGCTYTSEDVFYYGDTWVGCAARDDAGNYVTCNFTVTVRDTEPPSMECNSSIYSSTNPNSSIASNITINPRVWDNAYSSPSVICSHSSENIFELGETNVTCSATDESGNTGYCTLLVIVQDNEPPVIECQDRAFPSVNPSNIKPSLSDNVDPNPSIDCSPSNRDDFRLGGTNIECSATDSSNNSAVCNFVFTFQDPCQFLEPCNDGKCTSNQTGHYRCDCYENFQGTNCERIRESIRPVSVAIHPKNQTVKMNDYAEFKCRFNDAKSYEWYKDYVLLPEKNNLATFKITSVSASDIGYYYCRGQGNDGSFINTETAFLYIEDMVVIKVSNLIYNTSLAPHPFQGSSSIEATSRISNYVLEGLKNLTVLRDLSPSVVCNPLAGKEAGAANLTVYIQKSNWNASTELNYVRTAFQTMAENSSGFLDLSIVVIQNTAICKNYTWKTERYGSVDFPEGEYGMSSNSSGECPFNTTNPDHSIGRAKCVGDLISQSTWLPEYNCGPIRNVTDLLNEISEVNVSGENVIEVSDQADVVTRNTEEITSENMKTIKTIISQVFEVVQKNFSIEATASVVGIISNIASVDQETLKEAEKDGGSVNGIMQTFEQQIKNISVQNGTDLTIQKPKVAVKVQSLSSEDFKSGIVLSVTGDSASDLTKSNTTIKKSGENDAESTNQVTLALVIIPPAITEHISKGSNTSKTFISLFFVIFATPSLFISQTTTNSSVEELKGLANTPVVSLSVGNEKIENLTEPINFTFNPITPRQKNPKCSYWEVSDDGGYWSEEGCVLVSSKKPNKNRQKREVSEDGHSCNTPYEDEERKKEEEKKKEKEAKEEEYICACDHLTNFAVIMDPHREDRSSDYAYKVLTYIGCVISIISLLITLATYLTNRVLREKQTNQIFICLCVTLLGLYVTFIAMMTLDKARRECQINTLECGIIAGFVHYFAVSSIAWMGVEGYNTYLIIVKIFDTYIERFMLKAGAVAWGIPALIVVVTALSSHGEYVDEKLCFPKKWSQIGGLLIPITIIILFNVVIFGLVVRQLQKSSNVAGRAKRDAKAERRENIERVQNAICILLLLGLAWITGYFVMIKEISQLMEPIFIVLNCFQGFFIFLLYCARKPMVRKQWGLTCHDRRSGKYDLTSSSSGTTHSSKNISLSATTTSCSAQEKAPMLQEKSIDTSIF